VHPEFPAKDIRLSAPTNISPANVSSTSRILCGSVLESFMPLIGNFGSISMGIPFLEISGIL
jgi:hypothetical protein